MLDGVTFYVKYLGSTLVEKPSGEEATADAIKTIILMVSKSSQDESHENDELLQAKKQDKKLCRVALTISLRGIKMVDMGSQDTHLEVSIYRQDSYNNL